MVLDLLNFAETKEVEMIKVPVYAKFDMKEKIGELLINEDSLPKEPDYCFSLAYMTKEAAPGYHLVAVSLMPDLEYRRFLKDKCTT